MRSLAARVRRATLLDAEQLWSAYGSDPAPLLQNQTLAALQGVPGFRIYLEVDGHELFALESTSAQAAGKPLPSPYGYTRLPRVAADAQRDARAFADGAHPSWADASPFLWPMLSSSTSLFDAACSLVDVSGGGAVALGPVGEGKSLGLRQVASALTDRYRDWTVLWREARAPP